MIRHVPIHIGILHHDIDQIKHGILICPNMLAADAHFYRRKPLGVVLPRVIRQVHHAAHFGIVRLRPGTVFRAVVDLAGRRVEWARAAGGADVLCVAGADEDGREGDDVSAYRAGVFFVFFPGKVDAKPNLAAIEAEKKGGDEELADCVRDGYHPEAGAAEACEEILHGTLPLEQIPRRAGHAHQHVAALDPVRLLGCDVQQLARGDHARQAQRVREDVYLLDPPKKVHAPADERQDNGRAAGALAVAQQDGEDERPRLDDLQVGTQSSWRAPLIQCGRRRRQ
jgi:hypothetical protein